MRIVQISDVHFTSLTWNPLSLCSKRLAGVCNWLLSRKTKYDHEPLKRLPALFKSLKVDMILFGGDLTTTSLPSEFELAKHFFNTLSPPKLFIPGNHDQYTKSAHREKRFYKHFRNLRKGIDHPAEFFTLKDHGVEAHRLNDSWWCVALDTAPSMPLTSSNGLFSPEQEKHLEEVLQLIGPNQSIALLNHFPFFQNDLPQHRLIRGDDLRKVLEKHPSIKLYLHGHTHRHTIADLQPNNLPLILDAGCPIEQPESTWNLLDLTDESCAVQPHRWNGSAWIGDAPQTIKWKR